MNQVRTTLADKGPHPQGLASWLSVLIVLSCFLVHRQAVAGDTHVTSGVLAVPSYSGLAVGTNHLYSATRLVWLNEGEELWSSGSAGALTTGTAYNVIIWIDGGWVNEPAPLTPPAKLRIGANQYETIECLVDFYIGYPNWSSNFSYSSVSLVIVESNTPVSATSEPRHPDKEFALTIDPINVISGNQGFESTDLFVPCPGIPLSLERYYNSVNCSTGTLGQGWTHSYDWTVAESNIPGISVPGLSLSTGDGGCYWFRKSGLTTYGPPYENNWRIEVTNGAYELTMPGAIRYCFSTNGTLSSIEDAWNNAVNLSYTNTGTGLQVSRAEHTCGLAFELSYTNDRLARVQSPDTNLWMEYGYTVSGVLTSAVRCAGGQTSVTYYSHGNGFITQKVDAAGTAFAYAYTNGGKGVAVQVGGGYYEHSVDYVTPGTSVVTYVRGSTNQTLIYAIDTNTLSILSISGPGQSSRTLTRDLAGNILNDTVAVEGLSKAYSTELQYDSAHNVLKAATTYGGAATNEWSYGWHSTYGVPVLIIDPTGAKTWYSYTNALPAVMSVYFSSTGTYDTAIAYTTNGLLAAVTNANGHWTRYFHDAYGNTTSVVPQIGPSVQMSYSQLGFVTNILSSGRETKLDVNELGWVNSVTYPDGLDESFLYDNLGNLTNHIDTAGRVTRYEYLPTRKLSAVTRYLSPETTNQALRTSVSYDDQFNTLHITDALDRPVETYVLDIEDRPVSITNLEGQTMSVEYEIGNYVSQITRFDGTIISNEYNSDGLVSSVRGFPSAGSGQAGFTNTYGYLANGLLKSIANKDSAITNSYNFANRLTNSTAYALGSCPFALSYAYLPAGNLSAVTSLAGTVAYGYDEAERLTNITASSALASCRFALAYSATNGLLDTMTCTNTGITVSNSFDIMDRLAGITYCNSTNGVLASFAYSYNNAGMITNVTRSGIGAGSTVYSYDELNRLLSECSVGAVPSVREYSYDLVGNRTSKTNSGSVVSYQYSNGCNRLLGWSATGVLSGTLAVPVSGYSSEAIGTNPNLGQLYVSNTVTGASVEPAVSGTNFAVAGFLFPLTSATQQIVAAIGDAAGNVGYATNTITIAMVTNGSYSYSVAGCVTSIQYIASHSTQTVDLAWDGLYQLTSVATNGAVAESYGFDVLGRRISITTGTNTFYMVYDGAQVVADVNSTGGLIRAYTWGPGIDNLLAMTVYTNSGGTGSTPSVYYPITDHLGTIHALVDSSGTVVESYRFDAWGRVLGVYDGAGNLLTSDLGSLTSALGNRYLWQGREYSFKTGLYHFRTRFYDPITGRWLSNDSIGIAGGLNQYVAFGNAPTVSSDPFGLCDEAVIVKGNGFLGDYASDRMMQALVESGWIVHTMTPEEFVSYDRPFQGLILIGHGAEDISAELFLDSVETTIKRSGSQVRLLGALSCHGADFVSTLSVRGNTTSDALLTGYWGYGAHFPLRIKRVANGIKDWGKNPEFESLFYGNAVYHGFGMTAGRIFSKTKFSR